MKACVILEKGIILVLLLAVAAPAISLPAKAQIPETQRFETPPLLYLSATRQFGTVYLQWSVSEDYTPLHFAIERTVDRIQHTEIVSHTADGLDKKPTRYSYIEPYAAEELTWYRLRISDRSGKVHYSPYALPIDALGTKRLRIYPSPGPGHQVQLTLHDPPTVPVLVTIHDRLGFTRYQQWHAPGERITVRFYEPTQTLPSGQYAAVVSSPQVYMREKFIVE